MRYLKCFYRVCAGGIWGEDADFWQTLTLTLSRRARKFAVGGERLLSRREREFLVEVERLRFLRAGLCLPQRFRIDSPAL
jgi:hypothetical protein